MLLNVGGGAGANSAVAIFWGRSYSDPHGLHDLPEQHLSLQWKIWVSPVSGGDALEISPVLLIEQMPMLLGKLDLIAALSGEHPKNVCALLRLLQIGTFGNSLLGTVDTIAHTDISLFDGPRSRCRDATRQHRGQRQLRQL